MIDFRYHLVSLISVFLALAVGIVLGAGPLKETIGDTLTGQVSQLREEKDALRAELDLAQKTVADGDRFVTAVSGTLLEGALTERRIGLVLLDEVPEAELAELVAAFETAGASVPVRVALTGRWTAEEDQVFRSALAARLAEYLEPAVDTSATADDILAAALAQSLAGKDPAAPTSLSPNAAILAGLLTAEDGALVEVLDSDGGPVDAILVVSRPEVPAPTAADGASPEAVDEDELRARQAAVRAQAAVVLAAQQRSEGAILVTTERVEGGLVSYVRGTPQLAERLSTATAYPSVAGRLNAVLGLGARIALQVGHYGVEDDATAPAATRVELPPVDRTPLVLPEDSQEEGEDEQQEDTENQDGEE